MLQLVFSVCLVTHPYTRISIPVRSPLLRTYASSLIHSSPDGSQSYINRGRIQRSPLYQVVFHATQVFHPTFSSSIFKLCPFGVRYSRIKLKIKYVYRLMRPAIYTHLVCHTNSYLLNNMSK